MTVGPLGGDTLEVRRSFRLLCRLFEEVRADRQSRGVRHPLDGHVGRFRGRGRGRRHAGPAGDRAVRSPVHEGRSCAAAVALLCCCLRRRSALWPRRSTSRCPTRRRSSPPGSTTFAGPRSFSSARCRSPSSSPSRPTTSGGIVARERLRHAGTHPGRSGPARDLGRVQPGGERMADRVGRHRVPGVAVADFLIVHRPCEA